MTDSHQVPAAPRNTDATKAVEKRVELLTTKAVEKRVELLSDKELTLPQEAQTALKEINQAIYDCAQRIIKAAVTTMHDGGRLIHTMDLLRQVKDTANVALQLPHV